RTAPAHRAISPSPATIDASTAAASAAPERSVAVLPFVDMSEKKDSIPGAASKDELAEVMVTPA
ncbi:MAG TPA: hypothetical protein VII35_17365, partial [Steroidobacteraceae bacterium]